MDIVEKYQKMKSSKNAILRDTDKVGDRPIKDYFSGLVDRTPDSIFPLILFDPKVRKENNLKTPLLSKIKPQYDLPGCYVFFEPCNQDNEIEIMYIGRSATLRNRITGHWGNYNTLHGSQRSIVTDWSNYCEANDYPYCPHVAIFISYGKLFDLEHWLMKLKSRFNIQ